MKILFKQKQWMVVQVIFALIGILLAFFIRTVVNKPVGGLAISLNLITKNTEYTLPIFFILFSDLAFNIEYIQGTFLTHLLCGQEKLKWVFKQSIYFYLFILVQFLISIFVVSIGAGLITGHFGLEGIDTAELQIIGAVGVLKEFLKLVSLTIVKMLAFVSFGVFVTTLFPGKLAIGSIASIGASLVCMRLIVLLSHTALAKSIFVRNLIGIVLMQDLASAWSWIFAVICTALFTWLTVERVKRIEIASRGA
jgi:hypothetical protein